MGGLLVIGLVVAAAATVVAVVGRRSAAGRLAPNPWAGIRLPSTMASETAWYAAHRAGGPVLAVGGSVAGVVAVAAILLGLATEAVHGYPLVMVALAVLLTATLWSGWRAHRAAQATLR
jgi:uncharacterized membrane protein